MRMREWVGDQSTADLCIGITQLDGDVTDQLVLETNSHDSRDCLNHGRFAVSDMPDSSCPKIIPQQPQLLPSQHTSIPKLIVA